MRSRAATSKWNVVQSMTSRNRNRPSRDQSSSGLKLGALKTFFGSPTARKSRVKMSPDGNALYATSFPSGLQTGLAEKSVDSRVRVPRSSSITEMPGNGASFRETASQRPSGESAGSR
jgi:hypothetical protein